MAIIKLNKWDVLKNIWRFIIREWELIIIGIALGIAYYGVSKFLFFFATSKDSLQYYVALVSAVGFTGVMSGLTLSLSSASKGDDKEAYFKIGEEFSYSTIIFIVASILLYLCDRNTFFISFPSSFQGFFVKLLIFPKILFPKFWVRVSTYPNIILYVILFYMTVFVFTYGAYYSIKAILRLAIALPQFRTDWKYIKEVSKKVWGYFSQLMKEK